MTESHESSPTFPWQDGKYKATGCFYSDMHITGGVGQANGTVVTLKQGEFGETDQKIMEETGQHLYTVELNFIGLLEYGVVSEDGLKITLKAMMGVGVLEWMTDEEATAFEAAKDPIEAPSHPYKDQPDNLGKFIWLTGAPGLGKSTTAQLLARKASYVYYEGDCFFSFKNPYIPVDAPEPSMAQVFQKPLRGEGLKERMDKVNKGIIEGELKMKEEEYNKEVLDDFTSVLCDDLKSERARIGGDWVVAVVVETREQRDFIRSKLGPELVFVVLDMEMEQQMERIRGRHGEEDESSVEYLKEWYKVCEPAADDEDNTVGLKISPDMTPENVVDKILKIVNLKY